MGETHALRQGCDAYVRFPGRLRPCRHDAAVAGACRAKTYVMKFAPPTVNEAQHQSAENSAAAAKRAQQDPAH